MGCLKWLIRSVQKLTSCSLMYLPLADATVITFLSPVIACGVCAYILKEPFTRTEQIAASLSLIGVVMIARPTALFSYFQHTSTTQGVDVSSSGLSNGTISDPSTTVIDGKAVTSQQKVMAVGVALVGVLGGKDNSTRSLVYIIRSVSSFVVWPLQFSEIDLL
jgi:drug/metabolite transporter (DMT)-like permease